MNYKLSSPYLTSKHIPKKVGGGTQTTATHPHKNTGKQIQYLRELPNLRKEFKTQASKDYRKLTNYDENRSLPRHIIIKMPEVQQQQKLRFLNQSEKSKKSHKGNPLELLRT